MSYSILEYISKRTLLWALVSELFKIFKIAIFKNTYKNSWVCLPALQQNSYLIGSFNLWGHTKWNEIQKQAPEVFSKKTCWKGKKRFCKKSSVRKGKVKIGVLNNSQNSQENTCVRVSFLIKLRNSGLQLY